VTHHARGGGVRRGLSDMSEEEEFDAATDLLYHVAEVAANPSVSKVLFSQSPSSLNTTPSVLARGGFAQNRNTHDRNTDNRNTHNRHAQNRQAQDALDAHNERIEMYKVKMHRILGHCPPYTKTL